MPCVLHVPSAPLRSNTVILCDGEVVKLYASESPNQLHAWTPCTKWRDVRLDIRGERYILPHLGIEPLLSSKKLIIILTEIFQ
jgi:hypothetical protein